MDIHFSKGPQIQERYASPEFSVSLLAPKKRGYNLFDSRQAAETGAGLDSNKCTLPFSVKKGTQAVCGIAPARLNTGATKTHIVVPVVRVVPIAIGAPAVISLIVPRAAAQDI